MVLGLHLLLTMGKVKSDNPGFPSLQWWSESANHQCQTRRSTTVEEAASDTPLRLFLFATGIRLFRPVNDESNDPQLGEWKLVLVGARPCSQDDQSTAVSKDLHLTLPPGLRRDDIEAYIKANLIKKRDDTPKVIEMSWYKDNKPISSDVDVNDDGVQCVIRTVPENWMPRTRKDQATVCKQRRVQFAGLSAAQQLDVHTWSLVPYRFRPRFNGNPHMEKHHNPNWKKAVTNHGNDLGDSSQNPMPQATSSILCPVYHHVIVFPRH